MEIILSNNVIIKSHTYDIGIGKILLVFLIRKMNKYKLAKVGGPLLNIDTFSKKPITVNIATNDENPWSFLGSLPHKT